MKKKLRVISVLIIAVTLFGQAAPLSAATRYKQWNNHGPQVNSFITAGGTMGYSTLLETYDDLTTTGALGGALGVGYELRVNKFLFATGLEAQFVTANSSFELPNLTQKIIDTQGKLATMNYAFDPVNETHRLMYMSIPVMIGAYHKGFYFGVGAKVGLAVNPVTRLTGTYETSGTYGEYVDDFSGMNNSGYHAYPYAKEYKNTDVAIRTSAVLEIGYDVLSPMRRKDNTQRNGLRIAVVGEYGLNNLVTTQEPAKSIMINKNNANDVTVLPYYQTHAISGHHVNSLYAGIKLTWIYDFSKQPCDCED